MMQSPPQSSSVLAEWDRLVRKHGVGPNHRALRDFVHNTVNELGPDWDALWFVRLLEACNGYTGPYPATDPRQMAELKQLVIAQRDGLDTQPSGLQPSIPTGKSSKCPPELARVLRSRRHTTQREYFLRLNEVRARDGEAPFDGLQIVPTGDGLFIKRAVHPALLADVHDLLPEEYWRFVAKQGLSWPPAEDPAET